MAHAQRPIKKVFYSQKFMFPSLLGVEMANMLVFSTSSKGKTTSKKSEGGMKAASSSHNTSPPDPRSVFDAAG